MQEAINSQLQAEMYSANLYLAMSAYCDGKGLKGFANWLRVQYQEENAHVLGLYDYLLTRTGTVRLRAIDAPPSEFGAPLEIFKKVLAHEQQVTGLINQLYEVAVVQKDFAAQIFLQWYVNEQVEEEGNVHDIIGKLELIGERSSDILYLDTELAARVFIAPVIPGVGGA